MSGPSINRLIENILWFRYPTRVLMRFFSGRKLENREARDEELAAHRLRANTRMDYCSRNGHIENSGESVLINAAPRGLSGPVA